MLRYARLTLLLAFFASFIAASFHVHEEGHGLSNIHESCSICLHGNKVSCLDSPNLESIIIDKIVATVASNAFVSVNLTLKTIEFSSISLRGPPIHIS